MAATADQLTVFTATVRHTVFPAYENPPDFVIVLSAGL